MLPQRQLPSLLIWLTICAHLLPVQVKHDDLKEAAQHYVEELVAGKEFIADQKGSQLDALSTGIRSVNEELASSLASLQQGEFVDPEAPPAEVVNDLEQLQARLQALKVGRGSICIYIYVHACGAVCRGTRAAGAEPSCRQVTLPASCCTAGAAAGAAEVACNADQAVLRCHAELGCQQAGLTGCHPAGHG